MFVHCLVTRFDDQIPLLLIFSYISAQDSMIGIFYFKLVHS